MNESKKKILLTGASGMIGSMLVQILQETERFILYSIDEENILSNLTSPGLPIDEDILKYDFVIHLAFSRSEEFVNLAPSIDFHQKILQRIALNPGGTFVNVSSQLVYGTLPTSSERIEEDELRPDTPYAFAKFCSEKLTEVHFENKKNARYINVRLASVLSENTDNRVTNILIKRLLANQKIVISAPDDIFSFIWVEDVASALAAICEQRTSGSNTTYNLGGSSSYSLKKMWEMILAEAQNKEVAFDKSKHSIGNQEARGSFKSMNSGKFMEDFDWSPRVDIKQSIAKIFDAAIAHDTVVKG